MASARVTARSVARPTVLDVARKKFKTKKKNANGEQTYREFMLALLNGELTATRLYEAVDAQGKPDFEYDDPNG